MGTYIVRPIFKSRYYRKYFEEAARINKFMKITQRIFGEGKSLAADGNSAKRI
jgi:hypothetical protein